MYRSQETPRDLNLAITTASLKHGEDDSDLDQHQREQQQQMSTAGLLRLRSAPSSLLGEVCEDFLPHRSSSAEAEAMFTRLMAPDLRDQGGGAAAAVRRSPRYAPEVEHRAASEVAYQAQQQHLPTSASPSVEGSYRVATSVAMDGEREKSAVDSSNLVRHSSSPAGSFSHLGVENGFAVMGGVGGFKGQLSFSSRQSSSSGLMSQISEIGGEDVGGSSPEEGGRCFLPGFSVASWDDSSPLSGSFSSMKRARDPSDAQTGDVKCHVPSLSHHFSLPKTSSEMAAFLQFQDAVPCKIRAKRGCATHPRSVAERVRRTRISERMRKLQELFPNMDKQTNTADMLDLAVEYIKDLEQQVKSLSESRASCTCSSKEKP